MPEDRQLDLNATIVALFLRDMIQINEGSYKFEIGVKKNCVTRINFLKKTGGDKGVQSTVIWV